MVYQGLRRIVTVAYLRRVQIFLLTYLLTYYRITMYMTACDLEKSFSFNTTVEIISHVHFLIHV